MEESLLLADLSNVSEEESQRIATQTRAAVYWAGNKGVSSQQAKDLYKISNSPQPQQKPPPPPSPPSSSPLAKGFHVASTPISTPRVNVVDPSMDGACTAACRTRNTVPRPIPAPQPQSEPHNHNDKRIMAIDAGDYWYRTSVAGRLALAQDASSTPPRSQSLSQSQPKPQVTIQSPPASPPRASGPGLVKQFSQLSTSETSQEHPTVLVAGSSDEDNRPGTTQIVDYSSEHSTRIVADLQTNQTPSQPKGAQSNPLLSQRSSSPSFNVLQRPQSPASSPSLGDRRSSPSLGGSPHRMFGEMNQGGGSSPGPLSSVAPTQEAPMDSQATDMEVEVDETGMGGSLETQVTAPTQIVTPELQYVSATPAPSDSSLKGTQRHSELEIGEHGEGTQPTQIVSPEVDMEDLEQQQARLPGPQPITPDRIGESSRVQQGNSLSLSPDYPPSPTRTVTTPLSHSNANLYKLDRSRKSSFAPPIRARPDAQTPIPQLNVGPAPLRLTQSRWDAARAEEEERAARLARKEASVSTMPPPRTPSPRRRTATPAATGVGTRDVLTSSTPFVSGLRPGVTRETPRLSRSPFSPKKVAADDPEDEDANHSDLENINIDPSKQSAPVVRRESSLPLEIGRQARLEAQEKAAPDSQSESETENESEDEVTPQRKPARGVPTVRRGRGGRGRGRGRGATNTPHTPHEARDGTASPTRDSTGKKRARTSGPKEASPAPAKRSKMQPTSTATPVTMSIASGTRVLAWWKGGDYYFGTITGNDPNGRYKVSFDDNTIANVLLSKLRRAILRTGDHVQVTLRDKHTTYKADAVVTGITHWGTKHKVRVAMGADGKGTRMEADSKDLSVPTKEVGRSWGDRTLDEDAPVGSTSAPVKRKAAATTEAAVLRGGTRLAGYAFVLTVKAEDVNVQDTQLDEWKSKLRAKIEGQGGVIVDEWDELFAVRGKAGPGGWSSEERAVQYVGGSKWPTVRKVFLLSGKMGTTPKYMMALALGVPCLSYKWVDEYLQDESSQWVDALLPRGWSEFYQSDVSQVVDPQLQTKPDMIKTLMESELIRRPFQGKSVLCVFKRAKKIQIDRTDRGRFFSRVARVMGAATVHLVPDNDIASQALPRPVDEYDFVVCENLATLAYMKDTMGATCRTTEWVKQCIIMGKVIPITE